MYLILFLKTRKETSHKFEPLVGVARLDIFSFADGKKAYINTFINVSNIVVNNKLRSTLNINVGKIHCKSFLENIPSRIHTHQVHCLKRIF